MNRYRKLEKAVGGGLEMCGDGAYGEVYKALDLETQKLVALKRLKSNADDNGLPAHAIREFTLLKALQVFCELINHSAVSLSVMIKFKFYVQ